ncbi:hypothetical protein [Saccharothrix sp. Mg75]|uniref:hypothetical protein n=1 Tax=Saccharothrix sp. Mg75 TaxID=3445357 RepID=UPI003EE830B4
MASGSVRGVVLVALFVGGVLLISTLDDEDPGAGSPPTGQPSASTTSVDEQPPGPDARSAAAVPVEPPESGIPPAEPGVDFTDPTSVARAYLVAAHTVRPEEVSRVNRRVLPYLAPDNPDHPRGKVVGDDKVSVAGVLSLDVVTVDENRGAIALRGTWQAGDKPAQDSSLVLHRQPDGRWLVTQESARLQPADR